MKLTGNLLIGAAQIAGDKGTLYAVNPATGEQLEPVYHLGGVADVERACALAEQAFDSYRATSPAERARFLETIARNIESLGDTLIERAMAETGLPRARLEGERARTCNQLRLFAQAIQSGEHNLPRIDLPMPERKPVARPDLRQRRIPLGPVAVFGASNFPLAFSVAGGDTASAFAAGCPVIVKAHSAHPGTSELVGQAIQLAVAQCGLPEGVFSLLYGSGNTLGTALVAHPVIQAVGFTGSRAGGIALMRVAQQRPQPIPFYGELSALNPVVLLPGALTDKAVELGRQFVASLTMGAGQFCTNPGLLLAIDSPALDQFIQSAKIALQESAAQTMLSPGIHNAYQHSTACIAKSKQVELVASGLVSPAPNTCQAMLYATTAQAFIADINLHEEMFGAASLLIRCRNEDEIVQVLKKMDGQLTATLHFANTERDAARRLLPVLERKAGRILANGWPTGVEVCHAMVHGGPWPATTDARTTSVGTAALERFLRPVCYQDLPDELLPAELQANNPLQVKRLIDGSIFLV
ncbi:aldehyde dehydrogenase (NADP(+)) [Cellvibrio sp. pealriver]|uniref:aldehyde dehydrogenase (NADP(+)) n=1 Tax=Cellvibrio sp. pealriver TaxID=1622269 RepID=UPI00066FB409|nr:aldehyde dehydrogenase (NADP(+)) [Cellvibrio sp. pealriver]